MITKIINEELYYEVEESGEIIVDEKSSEKGVITDGASFETISAEFDGKDLPENPLRIEAKLTAEWNGVRSCSRVSELRANVDRVAQNWIKDQLFQRRHLRFVRFGGTYSSGSFSNGRMPWPDKKRYCHGKCTFPIFIEFAGN